MHNNSPFTLIQSIYDIESGVRWIPKHNANRILTPNEHTPSFEAPVHMRRFSIDGKYLICFSLDLRSVMIYLVNGTHSSSGHPWEEFFTLKYTKQICSVARRGILQKDFCILTECGRYMIIAETCCTNDEDEDEFPSLSTSNPGTLPLKQPQHEFDFHFYVIKIETGTVTDHLRFSRDYFRLLNNDGVFLYKDRLGMLSLMNQTIHIFQVSQLGTLLKLRDIGWFCNTSDEITFLLAREAESCASNSTKTSDYDSEMDSDEFDSASLEEFVSDEPEYIISGLKERILTYMYKNCLQSENCADALKLFYQKFDRLASLVLWKFQILDERHLLLKLSANASCEGKALLVVFDMEATKVISIVSNTSKEFVTLYHHHSYDFETSCGPNGSPIKVDYDDSLHSDSHGTEAIYDNAFMEKLVNEVPATSQSRNESVYLRPDLFIYDSNLVDSSNVPKDYSAEPIRFYSRDTETVAFRLHNPSSEPPSPHASTRYLFHPTYPLVIGQSGKAMNIHYQRFLPKESPFCITDSPHA